MPQPEGPGIRGPVYRGVDVRTLPTRVLRFWRASLQFRTVTITVLLSSIAVGLIGAFITISIGGNLFSSRRDQVNAEAALANGIAQQLFDDASATDATTPVDLSTLGVRVQSTVLSSTTSPGGTGIAISVDGGVNPIDHAATKGRRECRLRRHQLSGRRS